MVSIDDKIVDHPTAVQLDKVVETTKVQPDDEDVETTKVQLDDVIVEKTKVQIDDDKTDDIDDIVEEPLETTKVQLGFSEPLADYPIGHESPSWWCDWDGGQIGGKPSWLNPKELPSSALECKNCNTGLRFLCQLYAPADQVNSMAYHRSFYVFGCPDCSSSSTHGNPPEGSVRVLRCQLPEHNDYYPDVEEAAPENWTNHLSSSHNVKLCQVCGQRGKGTCPVQGVSFCGRDHQKEYKKYAFEKETTLFLPSVYTKSELVVDEEPPPEHGVEEEREALVATEENDPDEDLEQDDLDEAAGKKYMTSQDPMTTDFSARVKRAQDQCLRYYPQWEGDELWMRSDPIPTTIPDCQHCGAVRKCEFQIMPQTLYHLLEDHRTATAKQPVVSAASKHALEVATEIMENADPQNVPPALKDCHDETLDKIQKHLFESNEMDWGVITVYTCTASCGGGGGGDGEANNDDNLGAYREEYAWKQPPP